MDHEAASRRQDDALVRLERCAELTRQRQEVSADHRERLKTNATIIEGANAKELMELQHELNRENRLLDYQLEQAHDARNLEREAAELIMRRRDDFIRHHWDTDKQILALELRLIEKRVTTDDVLTLEAQKFAAGSALSNKRQGEAKDFASHTSALEKDVFAFKEDFSAKLKSVTENLDAETIGKHLRKLFKNGKIHK